MYYWQKEKILITTIASLKLMPYSYQENLPKRPSGQIWGWGLRIRHKCVVRWKVVGQRKECSGVSKHGYIPCHSGSVPKFTRASDVTFFDLAKQGEITSHTCRTMPLMAVWQWCFTGLVCTLSHTIHHDVSGYDSTGMVAVIWVPLSCRYGNGVQP